MSDTPTPTAADLREMAEDRVEDAMCAGPRHGSA